MLQIIGYIFLIGIAIFILKFGFMIVIRCCAIGIVAFFGVGMTCLILYMLGFIESSTAWTLSKWAFYIGTGINIIEVLSHPLEALSQAWNSATDDSDDSSYPDQPSDNDDGDEFPGMRCCGNCRFNNSGYGSSVMCNHNPAGEHNGPMDRCGDYVHK